MITKPNTVLVATSIEPLIGDIAVGALMLLDGKTGQPVADAATLTSYDSLQFGVVKEAAVTSGTNAVKKPAYIAKTKAFKRSELRDIRISEFAAATEDTFTLLVPGTSGYTDGDNMHVKLTFKVDGFQTQKAEAYTFAISTYANAAALATAIANRINNNVDSWVTATVASATVTITAKKAVDFQEGAKSINAISKFNQVEFELAAFRVNGVGPYVAFGTVTQTANAFPGVGNPYIVRDQERDALGYEGHYHIAVFPNNIPASTVASVGGLVDTSAQYDCITFTAELAYRAPDESYMKSTPVAGQIYVPAADTTASTAMVTAVKAWAGL